MIPRYVPKKLADLWSDKAKYGKWLAVEMAACYAMSREGIVPADAYEALRRKIMPGAEDDCPIGSMSFDIDVRRILELEAETRHDVVAFLRYLEEELGSEAKWLHYGLTSSDVVDTAFAMTMSEALTEIDERAEDLLCALAAKARKYARTPMMGRTHGQHAEPTTFGLVLAGHYCELQRAQRRCSMARTGLAGTVSGAVGTYAHISPQVEERALFALGGILLKAETVPTQVVGRDRYAEAFCALGLAAAAVERLALTVRHLQRTEVAEVRESFSKGQAGSSAMPHKRNPIVSENLCGLARVVCSAIGPAIQDISLWHERDISHSSVERIIAPDATSALAYMLEKAASLVEGLEVDAARMEKNMKATGGLIFSEHVMLALVRSGMPKKDAYRIVQEHAMGAIGFRAGLESDRRVTEAIGHDGLNRCFDTERSLRHVEALIGRAIPEV